MRHTAVMPDKGTRPVQVGLPRRFSSGPLLGALLALTAAFLDPGSVNAQALTLDRFSLEPRIGIAFPVGDFGDIDPFCPPGSSGCPFPLQVGTDTGWRWAIRAHYALSPHWSVLGEFGKASLGCSPTFCGTDNKPGTQGFSLGVRAIAFPIGSMDIWVEGAGVMEQVTIIRTQDKAGEVAASSVSFPWSLGFSGGVGAELDLTGEGDYFFTPGFRFGYVPADPPSTDADLASVTATYLLFEIGFRVALVKG